MPFVDLTPFGFTNTESRVYQVLLETGLASGYSVARAARLARANAYGALEGLVSRGAATKVPGRPARYRPTDPLALVASIGAAQGEALDRLDRALAAASHSKEPEIRFAEGSRALGNLILQSVARAERSIRGVLSPDLFRATLPAWRRAAERATLEVAVSGPAPVDGVGFPISTAPTDHPTLLLVDDRVVIAADSALGLWSSHPALATVARLALAPR